MKLNKIICEDAFEEIKKISDESVNMILTDIPYGETGNDWDKDDRKRVFQRNILD